MSCLITSGTELKCRSSIGGVDTVYIANYTPGLSYSFDYFNTVRMVGRHLLYYGTFSAYFIDYTEPFSATQSYKPLRPVVGDVVRLEFTDPALAPFNGTQSITISARNTSNGTGVIATNRPYGISASSYSTTGLIYYDVASPEITMLPPIPFYKIVQPSEVASYNQTAYTSTENGTQYYEQITTITLTDLPSSKELITSLGQGIWVLLIKDMNGNYWISGYNGGAVVDASLTTTGKLAGDLVGTNITFKSKGVIAYKVTSAAALQRIV